PGPRMARCATPRRPPSSASHAHRSPVPRWGTPAGYARTAARAPGAGPHSPRAHPLLVLGAAAVEPKEPGLDGDTDAAALRAGWLLPHQLPLLVGQRRAALQCLAQRHRVPQHPQRRSLLLLLA